MLTKLMKRKAYPTDLTDKQWQVLKPHLPAPNTLGALRTVDLREILNGLNYLGRSGCPTPEAGCPWRMLPHDLPPTPAAGCSWRTVYEYFMKWRDVAP